MFRLFLSHHKAYTSRTTVFQFCLTVFLSYCIGDPFCITNHNYCLYGVRCPLLFVIGGGGFALVNLPVVLVYGYRRGSCLLDFCVDVCLPDRRWARASVPLWCILLLAGVVGFTRQTREHVSFSRKTLLNGVSKEVSMHLCSRTTPWWCLRLKTEASCRTINIRTRFSCV